MRELYSAIGVAQAAGKLLVEERSNPRELVLKKDASPSTHADRASARYITDVLSASYPSYGIVEEELSGALPPTPGRCWVVDPLESTLSYIRGEDTFGVMIGLLEDFQPVLGVVYLPLRDEIMYAEKGAGAYLAHGSASRSISTSSLDSIDLLVSRHRTDPEIDRIISRLQPARVRHMPGSFKITEVARGNATLFVSPRAVTMNLWDLCAPQAILEEAGGRMSDLYGNPIDYRGDCVNRLGVIASNGKLHDQVMFACQAARA